MILQDGLQAGDPLPSGTDLEARFAVSRTVVREALAYLAGQGMVSRSQGRETVVAMPHRDQLAVLLRSRIHAEGIESGEVLECRAALEVLSARGAAARRTSRHLSQLRQGVADLRAAVTDDDYLRADITWRRSVMVASGNRLALTVLDALEILAREAPTEPAEPAGPIDAEDAVSRRAAVVDAIEAGDAELAGQLMGRLTSHHQHVGAADLSQSRRSER